MRVHVAFASHDLVLWKFAGATDISTGKYMNCAASRQVDGWTRIWWSPSGVLNRTAARLREADAAKLIRQGWFDDRTFASNPAGARILEIIRSGEKAAWLKLSWMQYPPVGPAISESRHNTQLVQPRPALRAADHNWGLPSNMLFQDRFNDGSQCGTGLNAIREKAVVVSPLLIFGMNCPGLLTTHYP